MAYHNIWIRCNIVFYGDRIFYIKYYYRNNQYSIWMCLIISITSIDALTVNIEVRCSISFRARVRKISVKRRILHNSPSIPFQSVKRDLMSYHFRFPKIPLKTSLNVKIIMCELQWSYKYAIFLRRFWMNHWICKTNFEIRI